jgi:RecJ-like exonuclease
MKKFATIGLVVILLAFSAFPVLAAGPNHGHGNGVSAGQSSNGGDRNQNKNQDNTVSVPGVRGKSSHTSMRMRTPFYLQGIINHINTETMTVTVQVVHGNAQVKGFIGPDMPINIQFTGSTRIFKITQGTQTMGSAASAPANRVPINFTDLKAGDVVAIHGNVSATTHNNIVTHTYNATLVTVYVKTVTGQPEAGEP